MNTTKRGSTSPITITIPGIDLTSAEWVIVSIQSQRGNAQEFPLDRLTVAYANNKTTIALALTQAESLALSGTATLDVNWMLDGFRDGIIPITVNITWTLLGREV